MEKSDWSEFTTMVQCLLSVARLGAICIKIVITLMYRLLVIGPDNNITII